MKNVKAIIEMFGGLKELRKNPIRLQVPGYMPLTIEVIGRGPRGGTLLSILHWFIQNGDLMRDPDLEIEIDLTGDWHPIFYRQDSLGIFQEAVIRKGEELIVNQRLTIELVDFMELWDNNLKEQGFLRSAEELAQNSQSSSDF